MSESRGFFGSLFDLSFSSFITIRLVKVLYILTMILLGLAYVGIAVAIFSGGDDQVAFNASGELETTDGGGSPALGVLWLVVLGPLLLFFYLLLYRVLFELIVVVFRIFENTRDQLALTRQRVAPGGGAAPTATDDSL